MTAWTVAQLEAIDRAEELEIVTVRPDGRLRRPVPIWVVRVQDDIYARSFRGEGGVWYRRAHADGSGRVRVAGLDRTVTFESITDRDVSAAIDAAYRAKYGRYGDRYVNPMVGEAADAATLRITPSEH